MKNLIVTASVLALTLMVGTAQAQVFHPVFVDVLIGDAQGNFVAQLQSVDDGQGFVDLGTDTATVNYNGRVVESNAPTFLPPGAPFNVSGNGSIQRTGTFDTEIVALSLVSTIGGPFDLNLIGSRGPGLNFVLDGPPAPIPNAPGLFITSHRITPEPGSMVLLGLGAAAVLGTRRRKAA